MASELERLARAFEAGRAGPSVQLPECVLTALQEPPSTPSAWLNASCTPADAEAALHCLLQDFHRRQATQGAQERLASGLPSPRPPAERTLQDTRAAVQALTAAGAVPAVRLAVFALLLAPGGSEQRCAAVGVWLQPLLKVAPFWHSVNLLVPHLTAVLHALLAAQAGDSLLGPAGVEGTHERQAPAALDSLLAGILARAARDAFPAATGEVGAPPALSDTASYQVYAAITQLAGRVARPDPSAPVAPSGRLSGAVDLLRSVAAALADEGVGLAEPPCGGASGGLAASKTDLAPESAASNAGLDATDPATSAPAPEHMVAHRKLARIATGSSSGTALTTSSKSIRLPAAPAADAAPAGLHVPASTAAATLPADPKARVHRAELSFRDGFSHAEPPGPAAHAAPSASLLPAHHPPTLPSQLSMGSQARYSELAFSVRSCSPTAAVSPSAFGGAAAADAAVMRSARSEATLLAPPPCNASGGCASARATSVEASNELAPLMAGGGGSPQEATLGRGTLSRVVSTLQFWKSKNDFEGLAPTVRFDNEAKSVAAAWMAGKARKPGKSRARQSAKLPTVTDKALALAGVGQQDSGAQAWTAAEPMEAEAGPVGVGAETWRRTPEIGRLPSAAAGLEDGLQNSLPHAAAWDAAEPVAPRETIRPPERSLSGRRNESGGSDGRPNCPHPAPHTRRSLAKQRMGSTLLAAERSLADRTRAPRGADDAHAMAVPSSSLSSSGLPQTPGRLATAPRRHVRVGSCVSASDSRGLPASTVAPAGPSRVHDLAPDLLQSMSMPGLLPSAQEALDMAGSATAATPSGSPSQQPSLHCASRAASPAHCPSAGGPSPSYPLRFLAPGVSAFEDTPTAAAADERRAGEARHMDMAVPARLPSDLVEAQLLHAHPQGWQPAQPPDACLTPRDPASPGVLPSSLPAQAPPHTPASTVAAASPRSPSPLQPQPQRTFNQAGVISFRDGIAPGPAVPDASAMAEPGPGAPAGGLVSVLTAPLSDYLDPEVESPASASSLLTADTQLAATATPRTPLDPPGGRCAGELECLDCSLASGFWPSAPPQARAYQMGPLLEASDSQTGDAPGAWLAVLTSSDLDVLVQEMQLEVEAAAAATDNELRVEAIQAKALRADHDPLSVVTNMATELGGAIFLLQGVRLILSLCLLLASAALLFFLRDYTPLGLPASLAIVVGANMLVAIALTLVVVLRSTNQGGRLGGILGSTGRRAGHDTLKTVLPVLEAGFSQIGHAIAQRNGGQAGAAAAQEAGDVEAAGGGARTDPEAGGEGHGGSEAGSARAMAMRSGQGSSGTGSTDAERVPLPRARWWGRHGSSTPYELPSIPSEVPVGRSPAEERTGMRPVLSGPVSMTGAALSPVSASHGDAARDGNALRPPSRHPYLQHQQRSIRNRRVLDSSFVHRIAAVSHQVISRLPQQQRDSRAVRVIQTVTKALVDSENDPGGGGGGAGNGGAGGGAR